MDLNVGNIMLLVWGIIVLMFVVIPYVPGAFAGTPPPTPEGQLYGDCDVMYLTEFWYRQARINVVHEPASSAVQRIYDDETTQHITIEEPLVAEGESTNIGFFTNSTGHMIAKLTLDHDTEKEVPRKIQISYQSAGQGAFRTNLEYTGQSYCRVFDMFVREQPHVPTGDEILILAGEITNERFDQTSEKVDELSTQVIRANQIAGVSAGIVGLIGLLIYLGKRTSNKEVIEIKNDYSMMRQEYANMIQKNSIDDMHNALDVANIRREMRGSVEYLNTAVAKHIENMRFIYQKEPPQKLDTENKSPIEKKESSSIMSKIEVIKKDIQEKFQKKPTTAGQKFKEELIEKLEKLDEVEAQEFLHETYVEMYPKSVDDLDSISNELNERLYIIKHMMGKTKAEYLK